VLLCAVGFAFHIVLVGRLAARLDPVRLTAAQFAPAAALSLLAALAERPADALAGASLTVWGIIAFMALTATAGAFLIQSWAQRFTTPSHAGLMFAFEPVVAALAAYALLGEALSGLQAVGACLILAGIVIAELKQDEMLPISEEGR
jgi:drug/metabolite transporter (DMT)-like permease